MLANILTHVHVYEHLNSPKKADKNREKWKTYDWAVKYTVKHEELYNYILILITF